MKINNQNYKKVLISYLENELTPEQRKEVERYILMDTSAWEEFQMLKRSKLKPDLGVVFPNKHLLYKVPENPLSEQNKKSEDSKIKVLGSNKYYTFFKLASAIAAVFLLMLLFKNYQSLLIKQVSDNVVIQPDISQGNTEKLVSEKTQPKQLSTPNELSEKSMAKKERTGINNITVKKKTALHKTRNIAEKPSEIIQKDIPEFIEELPKTPLNVENTLAISTTKEELPSMRPIKEDVKKTHTMQPSSEINSVQHTIVEDNKTVVLRKIFNLLGSSVQITKDQEKDKSYYSLTLETRNISINKSIKTNF